MNKYLFLILFYFLTGFFLSSCREKVLPYLGKQEMVEGKPKYHVVRDFSYLNQDSIQVSNQSLSNQIYVTDFFFTSCPSICPKVMKQMLRIHDTFKGDKRVMLVSFTIDPKRDTPEKLKLYAKNIGADTRYWHFLHGDKDETLDLANDFFIAALEDPDAPGGFDHSGKIVLVDKEGHVRSFAEGTDPDDIPGLIEDINILLKSYE